MPVSRLQGPEDINPTVLNNPTWDDVRAAIARMDGVANTSLLLRQSNKDEMWLGGGLERRFYVFADLGNGRICHLMNPEGDDDEWEMICGVQSTEFKNWQVVEEDRCVSAARAFFERGELDPGLVWHEGLPRDWVRKP